MNHCCAVWSGVLLLLVLLAGAGRADKLRVGDCDLTVTRLAGDDFSGTLEKWACEGDSRVEIADGRLLIETPERGVATVWYRTPFAGDQLIRFRARVLPPRQASNINFFFCASLPEGGDFFAQHRTGAYTDYHRINNYTMTFTGQREGQANAPGYMRLRRNPGFVLLQENLGFKAEIETDYRIDILKRASTLQVFVGGVLALAHDDRDAAGARQDWQGGYVGFRTFATKLWFDDFAVYAVSGERPPGN